MATKTEEDAREALEGALMSAQIDWADAESVYDAVDAILAARTEAIAAILDKRAERYANESIGTASALSIAADSIRKRRWHE